MKISDDERREVVKRLRNGGVARDPEEAYTLLLWCVGIRPQLPATSTYEDAMVRLADLIEPVPDRTCRMIDNGAELCCSECDWRHDYDDEPKFCAGCGAEVVTTSD